MALVYLQNVRLSFPALIEAKASTPNSIPKFSADLLMAKDSKAFIDFMKEYQTLAKAKWGENAPQVMKMIQSDRKLRCYGSGEEKVNKKTFKPYEGYEGMMYLSANRQESPQLIKPDGNAIDPANTMELKAVARTMYGGCYVNAAVNPWIQDNQHGRGIRLELIAIQFEKDGHAFGDAKPDASGMFGATSGPVSTSNDDIPSEFDMGIPDLPFQM